MKRCVFVVLLALLLVVSTSVFSTGSSESAKVSKFKVGLTSEGFGVGYCMDIVKGAQETAQKLGIELVVADSEFGIEKQVQQVENFVAQNCNLIIIHPNNVEVLGQKAQWAQSKGIPVIAVSMKIEPESVAYVGFDWQAAAIDQAKLFAKALNGKGKVVMVQGQPGTSAKNDRDAGMDWLLKNYPDITLLDKKPANWNRSDALKVMETFLQAYPEIDGVFSHNDDMAVGILQAIKAAGRKNIVLVGCDSPKEALDNIRAGLQYGTIGVEPYKLGEVSIELANKILTNPDKNAWKKMRETIIVNYHVLTKENVDEVKGY